MDCLFCKIINKEVASKILYEDENVLVFLDINQSNVGHTLIVPKKHIVDIKNVDDETLCHMIKIAHQISEKIMAKLGATGMTYSINYGDAQEIKHLHLHLCPYYQEKKNKMDTNTIYELLK